MVRRHPHVFGANRRADSSGEVLRNWEELKQGRAGEGQGRGADGSMLDGVSRLGARGAGGVPDDGEASRVGFDWPDAAGVPRRSSRRRWPS